MAVILSLYFGSIFPTLVKVGGEVEQRKVLVIEDEQDIAQLLQLHLRDADCDVTLAGDVPAQEAVS